MRRTKNIYTRRRTGSRVWSALGVLTLAGLSLVGAIIWQTSEEENAALTSVTGEGHTAVGSNANHISMDGNLIHIILPHMLPEFTPGLFALPGQVSAGEPVEADYFEDTIFLGDSRLSGLTTHRLISGAVVTAVGVTAQTSLTGEYIPKAEEGYATLLEAAQGYGVRGRVYIMLGGEGEDDFLEGYAAFLEAVREMYPAAEIYIMAIPPVGRGYPGADSYRIIAGNTQLAGFAAAQGANFLNIFDAFANEDGYLPYHASRDGFHLSAEYNFILLDFLRVHTANG